MVRYGLLVWDFALSFMWVWAGALTKFFVSGLLGLPHSSEAEALKLSLGVAYTFFFAWMVIVSRGGSYNPLSVLSAAVSGSLQDFLFTIFARIPSQIAGAIIGVRLIRATLPGVGHGPRLSVEIHHGALTEGVLAFTIVLISLGLKKKDPKSFFMKTWMSTISKMSLHILGADLTGGIMNPASALGWAYSRGDHITREHLLVYWLAPIQATLLAVWVFRYFTEPGESKREVGEQKDKSE